MDTTIFNITETAISEINEMRCDNLEHFYYNPEVRVKEDTGQIFCRSNFCCKLIEQKIAKRLEKMHSDIHWHIILVNNGTKYTSDVPG